MQKNNKTEIISRKEALERGLKRYFSGTPCARGHFSERRTKDQHCLACERFRYERDSAPRLKRRAKYRRDSADKIQAWNLANKDRAKVYSRRTRGLPEPTRPEPRTCECCGSTPRRTLCLDHCHETGAFRGWLCNDCNLAIGKLGDNLEGIERARRYLVTASQNRQAQSHRAVVTKSLSLAA